jgi:chorismate mutase
VQTEFLNTTSTIKIDKWISDENKPFTIFGPCSAESESQVLSTAAGIHAHFPNNVFRAGIWKPRSRPGAFEGAGVKGLEWLRKVKEQFGMPVTTEIATPEHLEACLKAGIDMVWIGARTTVNPFSIQELADALKGVDIPVFIKNPINPDISLWLGAIERIQRAGIKRVAAIHRGFQSFENSVYRYTPRWELVIDLKSLRSDIPIICDASHISGTPELIEGVVQKALDLDFQGIMVETHNNPSVALSDAKQQITPLQLKAMMDSIIIRSSTSLNNDFHQQLIELRARVDSVDDLILQALINRNLFIKEIGNFKFEKNMTILQMQRWEEILKRQLENGVGSGLNPDYIKKIYELIHSEAIGIQTDLFKSRNSE